MDQPFKYVIIQTKEYKEWFEAEPRKSQQQILGRLTHIQLDAYFGHCKDLNDDLYELKFNDGRRIYYVHIPEKKIFLLLGGNKNGQDKDIKKAKSILNKIIRDQSKKS